MSEEQALGASCLSPLSRPQPGARCPAACAAPGVGVLSAQAAGIPHWLGARSPGGDGWPGLCPAHLRRGPARAALPRYSEVEARDAPSAVRESSAEPQGYPGCGRRNPSAAPPRTQSWLRARRAPPLRVLAGRSHLQEEVPWSATRLQVALWGGLYYVAEGHIMENRSLDAPRGPMGKWLDGKTRPGSPGDLPPSPAGAGAATCCCQPRRAGRGLFS